MGDRKAPPGMAGGSWIIGSMLALISSPCARGQEVFAPLVPAVSPTQADSFVATNGLTAESILAAARPDPEARNPMRWGPVAAHPHINYQFVNADGVRQATAGNPSNTVSTIQHIIYPGVSLQVGERWHVEAGVSLNYYTDDALEDSVGYNVGVNGAIPGENWTLGVFAGFALSDNSQIETAQQTQQQSYSAGVTAVYGADRRVNYDFSFNQNITLSEDLNSSYYWSTMNWVNYVVTTKTRVGFGLGGGYTILDRGRESLSSTGTDSANEQIQGRFVWNPGRKLSISMSGGAQIQQYFQEDGVEDSVSPIFSLSAGYTPWNGTSFSFSASHTIGSAISADQHTENSSLSFSFQQRLLKYLYLGVSPHYSLTDYQSNTDLSAEPDRSDEAVGIYVSLSTVLFKKVNVSTFFSYTDNRSDDDFYTYETRQFGFQIGYRF
jgi:hypothetical protein